MSIEHCDICESFTLVRFAYRNQMVCGDCRNLLVTKERETLDTSQIEEIPPPLGYQLPTDRMKSDIEYQFTPGLKEKEC